MSQNISFISESVIEEKRKKRQEEWEKTRTENDPKDVPEEAYDPRTLYERLQEQKLKKQEEFEESRKLKNLIKGLDNDEVEFLNVIDSSKSVLESQKYQEELLALEEYKKGVAHLNTEEQDKKLLEFKRELFQAHKKKTESLNQNSAKKSQAVLLQGAIKRKSPDDISKKSVASRAESNDGVEVMASRKTTHATMPTIQCIGRLPGIGCYDDNSDSCDSDRESDEDDCDDFRVFPSKKKGQGELSR